MTARPDDVSFYLDRWADEIIPCETTLEAWAAWLSKPDPEWNRKRAAMDGETFTASRIQWAADIIATRRPSGKSYELAIGPDCGDVANASVIAVRFGFGLGWSPENIVGDLDELRDFLGDPDNGAEETEYVAVGYRLPPVRLLYKADPPRLVDLGTAQ